MTNRKRKIIRELANEVLDENESELFDSLVEPFIIGKPNYNFKLKEDRIGVEYFISRGMKK